MSKFIAKALIAVAAATCIGACHAGTEVIEIAGTPLRAVSPGQAQQIVGKYVMSDGRHMLLVQRGRHVRADLDGEPMALLLAASSGMLRSVDGRMEMRFDDTAGGDDITVTLRNAGAEPRTLAMARH